MEHCVTRGETAGAGMRRGGRERDGVRPTVSSFWAVGVCAYVGGSAVNPHSCSCVPHPPHSVSAGWDNDDLQQREAPL
jgi:hypothetical protein